MTFAERDELAMELWKEGENRVICVKTYEPLNEIYETRRGDDCPLAIQEVDT